MALSLDAVAPAEVEERPAQAPEPAMPAESRLAMPTQHLWRWSPQEERAFVAPQLYRTPWAARTFVFGGAAALTAWGAYEMYEVVSVSRTTILQYLLLVLFTVNFSWIALAFTSALLGLLALLRRPAALPPLPATLESRTAVVMPVYNEQTARTFAAVQAIRESIEATGLGAQFDYFILSDSTDPNAWIAEERAFLALRERSGPNARILLPPPFEEPSPQGRQHRKLRVALGRRLREHAGPRRRQPHDRRLHRAPRQPPWRPIRTPASSRRCRSSSTATLLRAPASNSRRRVYGPVIATGLSAWMGRDGNYWGHNAIIRTAAFAAHAGLPDLRGKPPLGGHILSHDFVEAALIRRAGLEVYMLPDLGGSYEESPPSLIDLAARDRRWCQGNLQHMR
jgi:membrane glycosyltransferase